MGLWAITGGKHCNITCINGTCGIAAVCTERQDFDTFIIGAGGQQLSTVTPGYAVDRAFVVFVPPESHHWLLDCTRATRQANKLQEWKSLKKGFNCEKILYNVKNIYGGRNCNLFFFFIYVYMRAWFLPGSQCFRVSADSQSFRIGSYSKESSWRVEGHSTHSLRVLELAHFNILCFRLSQLYTNETQSLEMQYDRQSAIFSPCMHVSESTCCSFAGPLVLCSVWQSCQSHPGL